MISDDFKGRLRPYKKLEVEDRLVTELSAHMWVENPQGRIMAVETDLENTPIVKYLCGDKEPYREYVELLKRQRKDANYSEERLDKLYESISKNGYIEPYIVTWKNESLIRDGLHRACVVYHLYSEIKVPVVSVIF